MSLAYVPMREAAKQLGISVDTVRRRIRDGELHAQREIRPQGYRWLIGISEDLDTPDEAMSTLLAQPQGTPTRALAAPVEYIPPALSPAAKLADFVPLLPDWQTVRTTSATPRLQGWQAPLQQNGRSWWRRLIWV